VQEGIQTNAQHLHVSQTKVGELESQIEDLKEALEKEKSKAHEEIKAMGEQNAKMMKDFRGKF
jgi:hypothetical protein